MAGPWEQYQSDDAGSAPAVFTSPTAPGITVEVGGGPAGNGPPVPRGIRNNNPLNLKTRGTAGQDGDFAVYRSPEEGRAAADANLQAYGTKHGINTISGVVSRWAPPTENDTAAYISHVAQQTGIDPNAQIDLGDPGTRGKLLDAMQAHEVGGGSQLPPATSGDGPWQQYTDDSVPAPDPAFGPAPEAAQQPGPPPGEPPPYSFVKSLTDPITQPAEALGRDAGRVGNAFHQNPLTTVKAAGSALGDTAALAGGVMGGALLNAGVTEPLSRVMDFLPAPDKLVLKGGFPGLGGHYVRVPQSKADQHAMNVGMVNTALSGMRPNTAGARFAQPERYGPRVSPAELRAQANTLYTEIRNRGVQFTPSATQHLNQGLADLLHSEDPAGTLLGEHRNWVRSVAAQMAADPSVENLDRVRSNLQKALATPTAASDPNSLRIGSAMVDEIDNFMAAAARHPQHMTTASPQDARRVGELLTQARDTWRRMRNVQTVENLAESAGIRNATTHAGGNAQNFTKRKLQTFIDPTTNKALAGLSPAELHQLRRVVMGTPGTEALKLVGNLSPTKGLGMLINLTTGALTAGKAPLVLAPIGYAANIAGAARQGAQVDRLLRMLARGGPLPAQALPTAARIPAGLAAAAGASLQLQPRPVQKVRGK